MPDLPYFPPERKTVTRDKKFRAVPPVPETYLHLRNFTADELEQAYYSGYLERNGQVHNELSYDIDKVIIDNMKDWRTRFYVVWFCYIYENFFTIKQPSYAIEEIILEFQAPRLIDLPNRVLGTLYAGAGGDDESNIDRRKPQHVRLKPHYDLALSLLDKWYEEFNKKN